MGFYDRYCLPPLLDLACGGKPFRKQREKIVPNLTGNVLEIGIGSGHNLPFYNRAQTTKIIGVDPDDHLWKRSEKRRTATSIPVERIGLDGQNIPLEAGDVDNVLVTYSLCTIPDAVKALSEMHRVLKPGGRIWYCEHGKAPDAKVERFQKRIDPIWGKLAGGCQTGKDIPALFERAGIGIENLETGYIPGPRFAAFNYWGMSRQKAS